MKCFPRFPVLKVTAGLMVLSACEAAESFLTMRMDGEPWKGEAAYELKMEGRLARHVISATAEDGSVFRIQILTRDHPLQVRIYPEDAENTTDRVSYHYLPPGGDVRKGFQKPAPGRMGVELAAADDRGIRGTFQVELQDNEAEDKTVKFTGGKFTVAIGEGPPAEQGKE